MPQTSNKISSFIGFILLILIIAFTVFINFDSKEEVEEENKKGELEEQSQEDLKDSLEVRYIENFTEADLINFWKLEHIHTDSIVVNEKENRTYMKIYRELGFTNLNPFRDSALIEIVGETKMKELFKDVSPSRYTIYNGILSFKHQEKEDKFFKEYEIEYVEVKDFERTMKTIAQLILNYQIQSIQTQSDLGNFTQIEYKDGRKLFLIKKNAEIIEESYKETINNASYLNDSTKLYIPYY